MKDPNTGFSHTEWGVHWVYPDGTEHYVHFGQLPADRERAEQAVAAHPDREGSCVVQRTVTHSKWTAVDLTEASIRRGVDDAAADRVRPVDWATEDVDVEEGR